MPKIGDEVGFKAASWDTGISNPAANQYFASHISAVWSSTVVNLQVIDGNGETVSRTSIMYWNGEGDAPSSEISYCAPHSVFEDEAAAEAAAD